MPNRRPARSKRARGSGRSRSRPKASRSSRSSGAATPPAHIERRLHALRRKIHDKNLSGYLVTSRADQFYLAGFDGEDGAVLVLDRHVYLLTDGRFAEEAERVAPWARAIVRQGPIADELRRLVGRHRLARIGFDPAAMSVQMHRAFGRAIRPARLVGAGGWLEQLRLYKDEVEVEALVRAVRVAESAFRAATKAIRAGMTESQLAARLHFEMRQRGASDASFPIIVAEGPNASLPHAVPGSRRLKAGSAVLIDWGATVDHYRSDLTRVVFIHRIPPRVRRIYDHVRAAQQEAIAGLGPGMRMCDVDALARQRLKQAGMDRQFVHGLGHGIGLDIHEAPRLSKRVTDKLAPGMVVTVEPGVYVPGVAGVRIEDDVLVTDQGCRVLSRLPSDLNSMVI